MPVSACGDACNSACDNLCPCRGDWNRVCMMSITVLLEVLVTVLVMMPSNSYGGACDSVGDDAFQCLWWCLRVHVLVLETMSRKCALLCLCWCLRQCLVVTEFHDGV